MSLFVLVETDLGSVELERDESTAAEDVSQSLVRRPMRGLMLKDETFATMTVVGASLANSSKEPGTDVAFTSNFILQSITRTQSEKFQPVLTFGPTYGFFFGQQPKMYTFSAVLVNSKNFQWEIEWWENYEEHFRGTALVDKDRICRLQFDEVTAIGYLINSMTTKGSAAPSEVHLNFTMWVVATYTHVEAGDTAYPVTTSQMNASDPIADFQDELGDFISTGAAVRSANIREITASPDGFLGKAQGLLADVSDWVGQVGEKLNDLKNVLYGRNIVIPAGFAGSERFSGTATFASGTGFESLDDQLGLSSLQINLPATAVPSTPSFGSYFDNYDEYPNRSGFRPVSASSLTYGGPLSTFSDGLDVMMTDVAQAAFAEAGYNINNEDGWSTSEAARLLGQVAYGAASYYLSGTGSQTVASSQTASAEAAAAVT